MLHFAVNAGTLIHTSSNRVGGFTDVGVQGTDYYFQFRYLRCDMTTTTYSGGVGLFNFVITPGQ